MTGPLPHSRPPNRRRPLTEPRRGCWCEWRMASSLDEFLSNLLRHSSLRAQRRLISNRRLRSFGMSLTS